jgi:hypothetical protein
LSGLWFVNGRAEGVWDAAAKWVGLVVVGTAKALLPLVALRRLLPPSPETREKLSMAETPEVETEHGRRRTNVALSAHTGSAASRTPVRRGRTSSKFVVVAPLGRMAQGGAVVVESVRTSSSPPSIQAARWGPKGRADPDAGTFRSLRKSGR